MIKNGKNILKRNQLSFVITSDEVKETILDFILYQEIDFNNADLKRSF
jgi:hypothetical protein